MSGDISLSLDHVALVTPDLGASREDYEKLGFRLTRASAHKGRIEPDGEVEPWGSGNHCAMFRRGYFEILGVLDPSRYLEHFRALLEDVHGVRLVALRCESAEELHRSLKRRVGLKDLVEVGRDVPVGLEGGKTEPGLFRLVHLEEGLFPETELFFIEHATPDVLWQEPLLDHPNGVTGLAGVVICSEAPEKTAARFERVTLAPREEREGHARFALDGGVVAVEDPETLTRTYPGAVLPAVPSVAVVVLDVEDLEATRDCLKANGVTPHAAEGDRRAIWVRPERAGGVILEFV